MRLIDRTGHRYERLTVTARAPNVGGKDTNARWVCLCDCGNEVVAYGQDLKRGKVKSCGCWNDERIAAIGRDHRTHGMVDQRVYRTWNAMLNRCRNPNSDKWALYGGRGITVCERWLKFESFVSDMGLPGVGMTLDRIDPNGNYQPGNCRWASIQQQNNNRRNSRKLTHNGVTLSIADWARVLGITTASMHQRWTKGMPPEQLFAPKMK